MKSAWMGSGCSHHSVPSLSKTATRSATGTSSRVRATNSTMAWRAGPSDQEASASIVGASLARHHRDGLALEVHVGLARDVDRDAVDRAAGERPGRGAGVVAGHRVAAVAPDAEALAAQRELARLRADAPLADLGVAVVQRQRADRDAGRVLALLLEGRRQDQ